MRNIISVSEITKNPKKAFDMSSEDYKLVLCNNQPVGYLISIDNPAADLLHLQNSTDALRELFRDLYQDKSELARKEI
jgi:hypothetical protein